MNTSNHYTSRPVTADRVAALDRTKMLAFYRARFANAADFTFFMVGAFKVDDAIPLLARYIGALPSTGTATAHVQNLGIRFPATIERARSRKDASRGARRSSASLPIRRAIRWSRRRSTPRSSCSTSPCATSCARSSGRPTPCRSASRSRLPARRRTHRHQLRLGAREHRSDDRACAAGSAAASG